MLAERLIVNIDRDALAGPAVPTKPSRSQTHLKLAAPGITIYWYLLEAAVTKNTSISLGDHFTDFIEGQVTQGRYGSASEVVRAGLRLLEAHEAQLERLRAAVRAGEESGFSEEFDFDEFLARKRRQHEG
jgi:antitoxin ParD1/3/4